MTDETRKRQAELIPVELIRATVPNHRRDERRNEAAIDELAKSMEAHGQQSPIAVFTPDDDGMYELIYGERRLRAARSRGWETIWSFLLPRPADETARRLTITEERAVENLQRQDLNPVEEAIALTQLFETMRAGPHDDGTWDPAEAVRVAADRFGKSERWVRDRQYLARVSPRVSELVLEGLLPLGHAREIAKIGDHDLQAKLVNECFGWYLKSVEEMQREKRAVKVELSRDALRERVRGLMRSLKVVRWRLDEAFAGKPACVDCAYNSANDRGLFEHDDEDDPAVRAEQGVCLSPACFASKERAVEKAIERGVERVRKTSVAPAPPQVNGTPAAGAGRKKKAAPALTPAALEKAKLVPKGVRATSFARQARKEIEPVKEAKRQDRRREAKQPALKEGEYRDHTGRVITWKEKANRSWESATNAWAEALQARLTAALEGDPLLVFALNLLARQDPLVDLRKGVRDGRGMDKLIRKLDAAPLKDLVRATVEDPSAERIYRLWTGAGENARLCEVEMVMETLDVGWGIRGARVSGELFGRILKILDPEFSEPAPELAAFEEQYRPKPKGGAEAKADAKTKPKRKPKGGRKVTKKKAPAKKGGGR